MRDGWTDTTLGDIAEYINGYPFKPGDLGDDGTAVIRIKQLLDPMEKVDRTTVNVPERCVLSNGDVVFSWSGTLAVRVWNRGTAYLNQHLFRVVEKTGVSHEWLPLVIDHAIEDLVEKSHGTTMKHITKQTLLPHQVFLPPLVEQKRIVDVVSSVDAYIDALQQQANTACTARDAVLTSLLECIYPSSIDYSLKDIAVERGLIGGPFGSNLVSKDYQPSGVPVIRGKNLSPTSGFVEGPYVYISEQKAKELSRNMAVPGDLVATQRGTLGQVAQVPADEFKSYVISQSQMRFRPNPKLATKEFLYLQMSRSEFVNEILSREVSTANPHINLGIFSELRLKLPPLDEQKRIVEIVSSMDDVIQATEQAVANAKNLRSGLLSDLLSGEHEIPESYDKFMEAA